jgi:Tfp pilus assembly protein PilF
MLEKEPDDLFLNFALGLEYANKTDTIFLAEQQYKLVLSNNDNYIAAYYQLGKLYESILKKTEALEMYLIGLNKAKEQKNNKAVNEFSEAVFMLED